MSARRVQTIAAGIVGPLAGLWLSSVSLALGVTLIVASIAWRATIS